MGRGINKVILVGNAGARPASFDNGGTSGARMSLATTKSWKDRNTGERRERTEWHRLVFFGRAGAIAETLIDKGRQVYVEGELRTTRWTDQAGVERWSTDVIVREFEALGSRPQGAAHNDPEAVADSGSVAVEEDDIPF